jgi:hypothetical protein
MTEDVNSFTADEIRKRTIQQNKALHVYCKLLCAALNEAGLDMKKTLKPGVDIPWTPESVKNHLWRPIQVAVIAKESTTEMSTYDPSTVHEILNRHIAEKFGISIPWPNHFDRFLEGR